MRAPAGDVARVAPFVLLAVSVAGLAGELIVTAPAISDPAGWLGIAAFPLITVVFAAVGALLADGAHGTPSAGRCSSTAGAA